MTVKLVMLKSGEDIIADVKEIKSDEQDVIGYFFNEPLIVKMYEPEEPAVLSEGTTNQYSSKNKYCILSLGSSLCGEENTLFSRLGNHNC